MDTHTHPHRGVGISAVLFDLDGTLVDTAPDLVEALNLSLKDNGFAPQSLESMRHAASHGSMALVHAAIADQTDEIKHQVRLDLLEHYGRINGQQSHFFDGITDLLQLLKAQHIPFGVVTNKPARFARPLIHALGLTEQLGCMISGDSTLHAKPHTAPMLLAAQQINCLPEQILYLGDAERDLIAARNSQMLGGIALWGYIGQEDEPSNWPADFHFGHPDQISALLTEPLIT
jgi:2-phosphoglycolate phosphatase